VPKSPEVVWKQTRICLLQCDSVNSRWHLFRDSPYGNNQHQVAGKREDWLQLKLCLVGMDCGNLRSGACFKISLPSF